MIVHKATLKETEIFKRAVVLASLSGYANKVGCLAVGPSKIIGGTVNRVTDTPYYASKSESKYHAESAILQLVVPNAKVILYVARLNSDLTVLDSRPCQHCMRRIKETTIEQMIYQDPYGFLVREVI